MPDQPDQTEVEESGASADSVEQSPPAPDAVLEAVMARLDKTLDKRFSGFQSIIDTKIGGLSSQFAQLQRQSLSPEEIAEQEQSDAKAENEKLRQENQLLRLRADHPDAVDLITGAMGTATLEEQVAFIESRLGKQAVKQIEEAVEADESADSGESIPNPGTKPKMGAQSASFAGEMTSEMADAVLANQPRGALSRIFSTGK
jgi:hypothetical protein